jgi:uncharacterized membrane protein YhaH (DUF805 family)
VKGLWRLFTFTGRANRAEYWTVAVGGWAVIVSIYGSVAASGTKNPVVDLVIVLYLPIFAALIATSARRLHDRGESAWWLLLFTVTPAVISIFAAVVESRGAVAMTRLPSLVLSIWGWAEMGFLPTGKDAERFGAPVDFRGLAKVFD